MKARNSMLLAIESRLIPRIVAGGFVQHALSDEERRSAEMKIAFPFGRFKRRVGADLHLVEIQLDKYDSAKFVLNFGVVPPEGVTLPWVHLKQDDAEVSALPDAYRLYSRADSQRWFSAGWLPIGKNMRAAKAVEEAIEKYGEIEAWFATRKTGKHMRKFGFCVSGTSEAG